MSPQGSSELGRTKTPQLLLLLVVVVAVVVVCRYVQKRGCMEIVQSRF